MNIVTEHVYPPIPDRRFDWRAWDDDRGCEPGNAVGYGPTEAEAIADLEQQLDDADEAIEAACRAACECCRGTGWVTVRTTWPCSYVCAGEPPDDARGMTSAPCPECGGGS